MDHDPDMHDLAKQIVRLEGEIRTSRAENDAMESRIDARLAGMQADMAKLETDAAKRETDAVKREKQQLLAIAALIALATTILGILISLPV